MKPLLPFACTLALLAAGALQAHAKSQPNIIFIMTDDMGWAQPGFNGGNCQLTPNMDRLAKESLMLTQHYTHSVCAPTRGAFLTGQYAFRNWMDWRSEDFGKPSYLAKLGLTLPKLESGEETRRIHALDTDVVTIAETLQSAGYHTAITGKWHCGEWFPEHLPMGQGFDQQYGHYAWGIDYYSKTIVHNAPARFAVYDWHRNQKPVFEEGYSTDLIADEAVDIISDHSKDKPLFLYVAFNAVHGPLNLPPGFEGDASDPMAIREAMLKNLDLNIGKILKAVDSTGITQDTLLVLTNDNGPVLEELSHPYRGTKNTTFEGGVRTPCLVRWPGRTQAGDKHNGMFFISDWYATFSEVAGAEIPCSLELDSHDMTGVLFEGTESPRTEIVFDVSGSVRLPTIRSGAFKLMGSMLYDIQNDPYETTDVAEKHPELVTVLSKKLKRYGDERPPLGDKTALMDPPLPYVYGQLESEDLPAWLTSHVDQIRAKQPQSWAPGETPWPQAPKGAFASKMDGGADETGNRKQKP